MATNNSPMCLHPWTNIDIQLDGNIMPCCKWPANFSQEKFNIYNDDIERYRNSKMLQDLKTSLLNHEWHPGCVRCRQDEERGIVSKRQHDMPIYQDRLKHVDIENTDFVTVASELGLSCNLACVICWAGKSTTWQKELKKQNINFVRPQNRVRDRAETIKNFDDILHFELHGGDPLITNMSEHAEILEHFVTLGRSKQMSLKYHTNGTVYPSKKISAWWPYFESIELSLSIDGVGPVFEYQRWPGNWLETEKTVSRLKEFEQQNTNIKITVQPSFSAYTVYSLDELYQWCQSQDIKNVWFTEVVYPDFMQATVWPASVRKKIYEKLLNSQSDQLKNLAEYILQTDHSYLFEKFVTRSIQVDQQRNLDSRKFLPFAEYAQEYQRQLDTKWQQFYNAIKDPGWPDCESAAVAKQILPKHILDEIVQVHKGSLDD